MFFLGSQGAQLRIVGVGSWIFRFVLSLLAYISYCWLPRYTVLVLKLNSFCSSNLCIISLFFC